MTNSIENIGTAAKHTASALNHMVGQADLLSKCVNSLNVGIIRLSDTLASLSNSIVPNNIVNSINDVHLPIQPAIPVIPEQVIVTLENSEQTSSPLLPAVTSKANHLPYIQQRTEGYAPFEEVKEEKKQKNPAKPISLKTPPVVSKVIGEAVVPIKAALMPLNGITDRLLTNVFDQLSESGQKVAAIVNDTVNSIFDIVDKLSEPFKGIGKALAPLTGQLTEIFSVLNVLITNNSELIVGILTPLAQGLVSAIGVLAQGLAAVLTPITAFLQGLADGSPWAIGLATSLGVLTAAIAVGYAISQKQLIIDKARAVWAGVQAVKEGILTKAILLKNLAMLATPWGLIAAGVAGIVVGLVAWLSKASQLSKIQKEISSKAAEMYANERVELDKTYKQLEKTIAGSEERSRLIDELKEKYPGISAALENELRNANDLTNAYQRLAKEAKRSAMERAKAEVLAEESKKLFTLQFEQEQKKAELAKEKDPFRIVQLQNKIDKLQGKIDEQQKNINDIDAMKVIGSVDLRTEDEQMEAFNQLIEQWKKLPNAMKAIIPVPQAPVVDLKIANESNSNITESLNKIGNSVQSLGKTKTTVNVNSNSPSNNNQGSNGTATTSTDVNSGISSTVTGGAKSTNITINIGNMVEKMSFTAADMRQNVQDMQDQVLDALIRTINMSQSAAI